MSAAREHDCIQVVMSAPMIEHFEAWLNWRNLHLAQIPTDEEDLPTYIIGIDQSLWDSVR